MTGAAVVERTLPSGRGVARVAPQEQGQELARLRAENAVLRRLAFYDGLTGLWNRQAFRCLAERHLAVGQDSAVLLLDLNGFKQINDGCGHDAGDQVLATIAARMSGFLAGRWLLGRLGGDEFAGLRVAPVEPCGLVTEAARLAAAIAEPMRVAGRVLRVSAAIGLAMATAAESLRDALSRADGAMYQAKRSGGFPVLWSPALQAGQGRQGTGDPLLCLSQPAGVAGRLALGGVDGRADGPADGAMPAGRPMSGLPCGEGREVMPAPMVDPMDRAEVAPAGSYRPSERVWVHRGQWYPGKVRAVSSVAVLVDYWRTGGRGSMTDTVTSPYVMVRTEWVELVDGEVDTHGGQ